MESTISQKLKALQELQSLDSRLDDIYTLRGSLPYEIQKINDELEGFITRKENFKEQIEKIKTDMFDFNEAIKLAEKQIIKYDGQIENVRNNREYNALSKEKESQELDIKVYDKRKIDLNQKIEDLKEKITETEVLIESHNNGIKNKKAELKDIMTESEEEEKGILKQREKALGNLEERLIFSYNKLRKNSRNGLAVVNISRSACGGCFNIVQPQKFFDVKEQKKIVSCEYCGRILANVIEEVIVETPKARRGRKKATTKK